MRSTRGRGERRLEEALEALTDALNDVGAPWMIIGGVAIIAHGVRRMTADIDAVVRGDRASPEALVRALRRWSIVPRIQGAEAFARDNLVLLARHDPSGVELDISFGWTQFEIDAIAAGAATRYGDVTAPMARAEDLVVFKAMAARPKDIEDAATLLLLHRNIDVDRVRQRLGELAALADEPALLDGLEAAIAQARATRSRPTATDTAQRKPRPPRKKPPRKKPPRKQPTKPRQRPKR